jgi:type IV pilus assembly protein PilM
MARSPYTWGIDIGRCGLKALRCRMSPTDPSKLLAEAFDYIEYPMILSQPEADAGELLQNAFREFLGRNQLAGDRVAVAVPGQMALSKFIKLPPIESKKIPDIVRYEARQQIPFPLEQVTWDWQRLAGGIDEGGFVMDAEVAIFAMKREQFAKALAPLDEAGIEVDIVQLSPIALANLVMFDQLPPVESIDHDKPPASIVLVTMGVDSTDLVVTNGLRIWQRTIPIGGNTFTKAIVSDLKLTFAKAEHVKRNAVRAEDPKAVFRAMRPVFNEFASELQRSLNYFTGTDRTATIGKVLLLGNAAKLRGLSDYVSRQLQLEVQRLDKFQRLEGPTVLGAPAFRENRLAFGTAYGLALQGSGGSSFRTNLLPREIIRDRLIEEKKPWAVAALAGLLMAGLVSFVGMFFAWRTYADPGFTDAFRGADRVQQESQAAQAAVEEARQGWQSAVDRQQFLARVHDRRFQALDLMRAVLTLLPADPPGDVPDHPADRREIHVDSLDCQYFPDLAVWYQAVQHKWRDTHADAGSDGGAGRRKRRRESADQQAEAAPADTESAADGGASTESESKGRSRGPKGPGWVIQLVGHHYHNEDRHKPDEDEQFVRRTIVRNLLGEGDKVLVSAGPEAGSRVAVDALGIGYPVIVESLPVRAERIPLDRPLSVGEQAAAAGGGEPGKEEILELKRYDFTLQFCWQPGEVPGLPASARQSSLPTTEGL